MVLGAISSLYLFQGGPTVMLNLSDYPNLSSHRVYLRKPCADDASAIQAIANDWEVAKRLARLPHPYTLNDAVFFMNEVAPNEFTWIVQDFNSREVLGLIGLTPHAEVEDIELGYWLGRRFWGKGLCTEAVKLVLDFAFAPGGASKVAAGCFTDNVRSLGVLRKFGFHSTGESSRFCLAQGKELAHYDMLLTR
jgi:[ribosomal protein S5]-alanine N-acetyltransferase